MCNKAGYFPEEITECEDYLFHSVVRNTTRAYDDQVEKCLERYLYVKLNVSVDEVRRLLENFNNVKLKSIEDHCFIRRGHNTSFYRGKNLIFSVTIGTTGDLCVLEPWRSDT